MGKPIATLGCTHTCPQSDGPKPHVGGTIISGSSNVFVRKQPICRQGDKLQCASPALNTAQVGSTTVFVNGKSVARMGDVTAHQGQITKGEPSVLVG